MKFAIASVSYWDSIGMDSTKWRKSLDGTKALCHLSYAERLGINLYATPEVAIYDNVDTEFEDLLSSPEWSETSATGDPDSFSILNELNQFETNINNAVSQKTADLTAQLQQTTDDIVKARKLNTSFGVKKQNRPLFAFVDDDGSNVVLDKLLPLGIKHNVPFVVSSYLDGISLPTGLSVDDLLMLQNEYGWEIASHGATNVRIGDDLPEEQQYYQVYESWRWMRERGLDIETFVYPNGISTEYARGVVSNYYKSALGTSARSNGENGQPLNTYLMGRHPFPAGDGSHSLPYYTNIVDNAIANNSLTIFMLHCYQPIHDARNQQILDDLIAYIKSKNAEIVTMSEAMDIAGNPLDVNEQSLFISKTGANNIRELVYSQNDPTTGLGKYDFSTPPSAFEPLKVHVHGITSNLTQAPSKTRGTLVTYRNLANIVSNQFYYSQHEVHYRTSSDNVIWGEWQRQFTGKQISFTVDFGTILAGTSKSVTVNHTSLIPGQFIMVSPVGNILSGVSFGHAINGPGILSLTATSTRGSDYALGSREFKAILMDTHRF